MPRIPAAQVSALTAFQRWMLTAVSHPDGLDAGLEAARVHAGGKRLEELVHPSARVPAHRRLEIYADMYFRRLVDILLEDFPATAHVLGDAANSTFRDYLVAHPSTSRRLAPLGQHLGEWLANHPTLERRGVLADLAAFEYAWEVAFDGQPAAPLSPEMFAAIPLEAWSELRLPVVPTFRVLSLGHSVHEYVLDVRAGRESQLPEAGEAQVAMWRDGYFVTWEALGDEARWVLEALAAGATIGEALDRALDAGADFDLLAGSLQGWFERWTSSGLFAAPDSPA